MTLPIPTSRPNTLSPHVERPRALPRLLYISEVPIGRSYAGMAVLYRLLETYPVDRLLVAVSTFVPHDPRERLTDVPYRHFSLGIPRLRRTRVEPYYNLALLAESAWPRPSLRRLVSSFSPDAILTVEFGFGWRTAARIADAYHLPLHLIVHDHPYLLPGLPGSLRGHAYRHFARVYRRANVRYCVCPYMAETYQSLYGVPADVLYPGRAHDARVFDPPPPTERPLRVAYAGSLRPAYTSPLLAVANALARTGGNLLVFSHQAEHFRHPPLGTHPHITLIPPVPHDRLIETLRQEADVLYCPMVAMGGEVDTARVSFPSKLTEYTAAGLPILVSGPPQSTVIRWAHDYSGVAEVAQDAGQSAMDASIRRLLDPAYRRVLALRAAQVGHDLFDHKIVFGRFTHLLTNPEDARA